MNTFRGHLLRLTSLVSAFGLVAAVAHAQTTNANGTPSVGGIDQLGTFILKFIYLFDVYLVPLIFALAFIVFIWGIYSYFIGGATNEEKRNEGKQLLIYGLLGFFIMLSIWGIINLLIGAFGFNNGTRPPLPTFETTAPSSSGTGSNANTTGSAAGNADTGSQQGTCANGACDGVPF